MIYRDCIINISNGISSINETIILYRGDREVELYFTIKDSKYKFTDTSNIIDLSDASYAQIIIKVPNNNFPIFGEILPTKEGKAILTITGEMIDEINEIGLYDFQIRLYDENKTSRVTIPPIEKGIEVREPIAIEDVTVSNEVGIATVGYAEIGTKAIQRPTLNEDGSYNKKIWVDSETITKEDLNVLEDIADKNTSEIDLLKTSGGTGESHTHTNKTVLDKITDEKLANWDNKINSIPSEYVTDTELNNKGYLTQHQDISGKVDKVTGKSLIADTEISRLSTITNYTHPSTHAPSIIAQDSSNRFVTDIEKATWNDKSNFSGSYNDLTNKPTIPSEYTLPIATASTLGGIKVGAGLSISNGVLSTNGGGIADSVEWSNVQNKPSVFTPATHTHIKTDITDFTHSHTKTDITDFTHTHTITDLPTGTTSTTVALGNHAHSGVYEPVISTKNTAFNVNFDTTVTNIKMNGTQSLGSLSTVARADHIHPSDTTKVATTRTINSKPLSANITLTLDDIANGTTRSLDNYSLSTHNHDTNYSPLAHTHTNYDTAYTHSQSAHAPSNAQKNSDITKEEIEAKLTGVISSHSHEGTSSSGSGSSEKLLLRYTHTSNKVIQPTSFDFSTGIFTCSEVHGLKGGELLLLDFIPPSGAKFNQTKILKELYQFSWVTWIFLVVEVVTTTTFKLKNRSNNSYITYIASNTPNLDLNSFRFQTSNDLVIENLNLSNYTKLKFKLNLFTMSQTYPNGIKVLSTTTSNYPFFVESSVKFNNLKDISSLYYPIASCYLDNNLLIYGHDGAYRNDIIENIISIKGNCLSREVSFYSTGVTNTYSTGDNNSICRSFNCKEYFYDVGYDNNNRFLNSITINNEHKILNGSVIEIYDLGGE